MHYREVTGDREFLLSLSHGADWREEIESFAAEQDVDAAFFVGMGAVQDAHVHFYDQDDFEYDEVTFEEPLDVAACVGNVAQLDDAPFAHTHVVLSRPSGQAIAGHLDRATVFAGEVYIRTFEESLDRARDPTTDLDGWSL